MGATVIAQQDVKPGSILLVGGAGYIGRHIAFELLDNGRDVVILDNLSTGSEKYLPDCPLVVEDILKFDFQNLAWMCGRIAGVVHLAALTDAAESVAKPEEYLRSNVYGAERSIDFAKYLGARSFVFSSTAAVYGEPEYLPIDESHPVGPVNPYGWSKLAAELCLKERSNELGISLAILRYFNVAGADLCGRTGDMRPGGENVVHKLLGMLDRDDVSEFNIYGGDYDTPDGTPTRDYIHVSDLANAHMVALDVTEGAPGGCQMLANVGYGSPVSVKELVESFRLQAGGRFQGDVNIHERRPGDIGQSYASAELMTSLGWRPRNNHLRMILASAIDWFDFRSNA